MDPSLNAEQCKRRQKEEGTDQWSQQVVKIGEPDQSQEVMHLSDVRIRDKKE